MLQAIIFDVDGTLSETEETHRQAFNETFAAFGLDWHWDQGLYGQLLKVTGGKERLNHYLRDHLSSGAVAERSEDFIRRLHAEKTRRYTQLVDSGAAVLRPGIERLIREATACGIRLAIATTTSLANVEALLRACLDSDNPATFEAICAGISVAHKKTGAGCLFCSAETLELAGFGLPRHRRLGKWAAGGAGRGLARSHHQIGLYEQRRF